METTMEECIHGSREELTSEKWIPILNGMVKDMSVVIDSGSTNNDEKKALARIQKALRQFSPNQAEARRMVLAEWHAMATFLLQQDDLEASKGCCENAIRLQTVWLKIPTAQVNSLLQQIQTHQGVVRYLDKHIPCDCLKEEKKKLKEQGKVGICNACKREAPAAMQAARCRVLCITSCIILLLLLLLQAILFFLMKQGKWGTLELVADMHR